MIPNNQSGADLMTKNISLKELRKQAAQKISNALSLTFDESLFETDILFLLSLNWDLDESKKVSRAVIYSILDEPVRDDVQLRFQKYLDKRLIGVPIEHLTSEKDFYSYSFYVDQRVLIPRPETELLVDKVIELVKAAPQKKINLFDIGVGSGAIICSCVLEMKKIGLEKRLNRAIGVDLSRDALEVAKINVERFGLGRSIELIHGSLLEPLSFDDNLLDLNIIISNPPYLDIEDSEVCKRVKTFEPHIALFSENQGMNHYQNLITAFSGLCLDFPQLVDNSHLILEIGYNQDDKVRCLVQNALNLALTIEKDLSSLPRLVHIIPS